MASRFPNNYNRFTEDKQWEKLIFRAGYGLQSAELNELQDVVSSRIERLGRGIYQDGHVVENAMCTISPTDPASGSPIVNVTIVKIEAGRISFRGTVYETAETWLHVPSDQTVWIGIRYQETEQDEFDDSTLLDPAVGTRNYMEAGAGRLQEQWTWGWLSDGATQTDPNADWPFFYPVYEIDHGVFVLRAVPPNADPLINLLAKYDREAHGNYVVRGFQTKFVTKALPPGAAVSMVDDSNNYVFDVAGGLADIQGYKTERQPNTRLFVPRDPTLVTVTGEPHLYGGIPPGQSPQEAQQQLLGPADAPGILPPVNKSQYGRPETIFLNRSPVVAVTEVLGTKYVREQVTKGSGGSADTLFHASVVSIISVKQDPTTYAQATSWVLAGATISWSPAGPEPATGSTYFVEYLYEDTVVPTQIGDDYIIVNGLYNNTEIYVDYSYALPRKDLLILDVTGELVIIEGVSQLRNPTPPSSSDDQVPLATIEYNWRDAPVVEDVSPRTIPMKELHQMEDHIFDLYELVAIVALQGDQSLRQETGRLGIFVDPFIDDSNRDFGLPMDQDAVIEQGCLTLPVPSLPYTPDGAADKTFLTLDFTLDALVAQQDKTGCLPIVPIVVEPPPVIIINPPPPAPPPPSSGFTVMAWATGLLSNMSNVIALTRSNTEQLHNPGAPTYLKWLGADYWIEHMLSNIDATTKTRAENAIAQIIYGGGPGTYWGSVATGDTTRSGDIMVDGQLFHWNTSLSTVNENISDPNFIQTQLMNGARYHWNGVPVPSNAVVMAQAPALIASCLDAIKHGSNMQGGGQPPLFLNGVDQVATWDASFKTAAKAAWDAFYSVPFALNEYRTQNPVINENRTTYFSFLQFWPNQYPAGPNPGDGMVHNLYCSVQMHAPTNPQAPNILHLVQARLTLVCPAVVGGGGGGGPPLPRTPPQRRIPPRQPPPRPGETPPVQTRPPVRTPVHLPPQYLPIQAPGFQPNERIDTAQFDGVEVAVVPPETGDNPPSRFDPVEIPPIP